MNDSRYSFVAVLLSLCAAGLSADRPAPAVSRYAYSLELDAKSLPKGVTARKPTEGETIRYFLKNEGETPLVIDERFQDGKLVGGTKLVKGKVYGYFPNGVPMEGKTHLKGWQAPFGDIEEALLTLPKEPAGIAKGREPDAPDAVPAPESVVLRVTYDERPYDIKAVVRYRLNKAFTKEGK